MSDLKTLATQLIHGDAPKAVFAQRGQITVIRANTKHAEKYERKSNWNLVGVYSPDADPADVMADIEACRAEMPANPVQLLSDEAKAMILQMRRVGREMLSMADRMEREAKA